MIQARMFLLWNNLFVKMFLSLQNVKIPYSCVICMDTCPGGLVNMLLS